MNSPWVDLGPLSDELTPEHYARLLQPCYARAGWKLAGPLSGIPHAGRIAGVITDLIESHSSRFTEGVQCAGLRVARIPEGFVLQADTLLARFYLKGAL